LDGVLRRKLQAAEQVAKHKRAAMEQLQTLMASLEEACGCALPFLTCYTDSTSMPFL
jgi:hypothetical protein